MDVPSQFWCVLHWLFIQFLMVTDGAYVTFISDDIGNLSCHKCEETFETKRWDPFTDCQINPNITPQVPCLKADVYCMVERVSIKGMTTSIKRECAADCYYGCRAKHFGLTTLTCTSCCQTNGCNIDNSSNKLTPSFAVMLFVLSVFVLCQWNKRTT